MAASEKPSRGIERRAWWSALAVVLAAILLVAVIAIRLAPAGTRMAEHATGGTSPIGPTCTHYPGAEVSIVAPGAGTVVVSATVGVGLRHEFGTLDEARIVVAATSTDCSLTNHTAFVSVPSSLFSDAFHFETVPILRSFAVPGAGTYTFYVNAVMAQGWDTGDRFDSASLVAVYHAP